MGIHNLVVIPESMAVGLDIKTRIIENGSFICGNLGLQNYVPTGRRSSVRLKYPQRDLANDQRHNEVIYLA